MKTLFLHSLSAGLQAPTNLNNVEIRMIPVQGNVHLLAGAGGNITAQVGNDGVLLVDTEYEQLAPKIIAAVRKLSDKTDFLDDQYRDRCGSHRW
jgi:hypothetical protein